LGSLPLAILVVIGLAALVGSLFVAVVVQLFGHAVVVVDRQAIESIKRSAWWSDTTWWPC
jgi:hypothetical protein